LAENEPFALYTTIREFRSMHVRVTPEDESAPSVTAQAVMVDDYDYEIPLVDAIDTSDHLVATEMPLVVPGMYGVLINSKPAAPSFPSSFQLTSQQDNAACHNYNIELRFDAPQIPKLETKKEISAQPTDIPEVYASAYYALEVSETATPDINTSSAMRVQILTYDGIALVDESFDGRIFPKVTLAKGSYIVAVDVPASFTFNLAPLVESPRSFDSDGCVRNQFYVGPGNSLVYKTCTEPVADVEQRNLTVDLNDKYANHNLEFYSMAGELLDAYQAMSPQSAREITLPTADDESCHLIVVWRDAPQSADDFTLCVKDNGTSK